MRFSMTADSSGVTLAPEAPGLLVRLTQGKPDLTAANPGDHGVVLALGDLAAMAEDNPEGITIRPDHVRLSHEVVAALDGSTARALGLPPLPDLTFSTDVRGTVGGSDFRLSYRWTRGGSTEPVRRTGAILHTATGDRRIPASILHAIELADAPAPDDLPAQWNALARFRGALLGKDADDVGRIAMTDFLSDLEVHLASGFSIDPRNGEGGLDFEVRAHDRGAQEGEEDTAPEVAGAPDLVSGKIRERGALPAYRLARGSYLVVDEAARPVLDVMARMQKAPPSERDAFVRNPLPFISEALEADLERRGKLDDLGDADRQRHVEEATKAFVETPGYAERVAGIGTYSRPDLGGAFGSGTAWLPEIFGPAVAQTLAEMAPDDLAGLRAEVDAAVEAGRTEIIIGETTVPIDRSAVAALDAEIERRQADDEATADGHDEGTDGTGADDEDVDEGPQILVTEDNLDELGFAAQFKPRHASGADSLPNALRTPLHSHQDEGLAWAQSAWRAGLPGILNADEQGLGKTLQTIAFLAWMKERLAEGDGPARGPVLVVAPTSLLENWEAEVARHLKEPGLGTLIRLYGSGISAFRVAGAAGRDTDDATERLDFRLVHEALAEGRAHRMWMLTTYQTLTNYQHSLGRIPFSAIVFDEIQALKNPGTLAAMAAKAMNGDFRIGLTGTPVENTVDDLWSILDQLAPGYLGSLKEFRGRYPSDDPDPATLADLHARVFGVDQGHPPIGMRRLKETAASHLPKKARLLHPGIMPDLQATAYETARVALAGGGMGAALKMLHRIRGVSLHPDPGMDDGFEEASARLSAALRILDRIKDQGERALVFIEDRRMQHRFVALARARFGLDAIDVINGQTPIKKRQAIVDRFQEHLGTTRFDLLVLGPKAAGTGLTLTAATHVIHLSRWWNPAVEEQCNDRVHRIGQNQPVAVHLPMAVHPRYGLGSFDCQLQLLMERKRRLARVTLFPAGETSADASALRSGLLGDEQPIGCSLHDMMRGLYRAMGRPEPMQSEDGAYSLQ